MSIPNYFKVLSCEVVWIDDAGVTVHNSPHLRDITNQTKSSSKEQVTVGNVEKMESKAVGELKGIVTYKNGNPELRVTLKGVVFTSQSQFNLLSLTKLMSEG